MNTTNFIKWINNIDWDFPYWYWRIMLKLYILCLEHNIDTSIIVPEIKNWYLWIQVNWLVPTEFLVWVHCIENEAMNTCCVCWMFWKYRKDIYWVYCFKHYILEKLYRLRKGILLNFK